MSLVIAFRMIIKEILPQNTRHFEGGKTEKSANRVTDFSSFVPHSSK